MKPAKILLFSSIIVLCSLLPLSSRAEVVDRIVAIVNDDFITLMEVERHVRVENEGKFRSVNEYFRNMRLREKIDSFIDDLLIRQQAKKLRIETMENKEVDAIIANIRKQYLITEDELKEQFRKEGIGYKDFYEGIRMNTLRSRVLNRVISPEVLVTDKILRDFYDTHIDEYRDEEYRVQQIFISGQREDGQRRALAAYGRLQEGQPFEAVAREFSDDPSAAGGGDIGTIRKEELIPELRQAVSQVSPGNYTTVLKTPYGLQILKVNAITKGEMVPFETVKDRIHQRIVQEESEKRYKEYIDKLRAASYIEVKF
jgi:peptidyl-prolyl cis-trans isomerase SurA